MMKISKGLDIPLPGSPIPEISPGQDVTRVALVAADYVGLRPSMAVRDGDRVRLGQPLMTDKSNPDIRFVAPGAGTVRAVNRGAKRKLISIEIDLEGDDEERFATHGLATLTGDQARDNLLQSGLWTALRTRPFNRIPDPKSDPHSIFVTAMDTNPLAGDPVVIINESAEDFAAGVEVLTRLTDGSVYVCHEDGSEVPGGDVVNVTMAAFSGPHPAGLPGTHIHFLDPVHPAKTVWFIGYQDVMAIGMLFRTGRISTDRVVALSGPGVQRPRLVATRLGACIDEVVRGNLHETEQRVVSGSLLAGRKSVPPANYLGRYHHQISVLPEGRHRELFGWQTPGADKYSVTRTFLSAWLRAFDKVKWTTSTHGSRRAMVPIGLYEQVMPLDLLPTQLLRALIVEDTEDAQRLGCLELDEEDLGLCSFVCPSKYDYGPILRENLNTIEREG
jgi:Na+-transporting NADH:ubiquinone oxidoreductase subunit A